MRYRRDKAALKTTCIENVKFKIIRIMAGCLYVGCLYYSENLNWAAQIRLLGYMRLKKSFKCSISPPGDTVKKENLCQLITTEAKNLTALCANKLSFSIRC